MTKKMMAEEGGFLKFNNVLDTVITLSIVGEEAKTALGKCSDECEEDMISEFFSSDDSCSDKEKGNPIRVSTELTKEGKFFYKSF